MSADKLQLFHQEIMQEEGIKISDLPEDIQKKLRGFNLLKAGYDKNPQERTLINLRKRTIKLGDEIQSFIENDYEDEDEDDDKGKVKDDNKGKVKDDKSSSDEENSKKEKTVKSEKKFDDDVKGDNPVKQKPVSTGNKFGNLMMEKKILAIMEAKGDNRIKIADLESIIGREPEYPEQRVNNIKLRKVFLSSDYRLV
jgi:hypothetical protein